MNTAITTKKAQLALALAALLVAIAGAFAAMNASAQQAWADSPMFNKVSEFNKFMKDDYVRVTTLTPQRPDMRFYSVKAKITNVRSTNPKVVSVKAAKYPGQPGYWTLILTHKKVGKTTIGYTIKGKRYRASITIVKSLFPFAKFQVGNTSCINWLKSESSAYTDTKLTGTFRVKPAAGWKVTKAKARTSSGKWYTLRNGAKLKAGTTRIEVNVRNAKFKLNDSYSVTYESWD